VRLTPEQQLRLAALFRSWLSSLHLPIPDLTTSEPIYTGEVLLPRVEEWVRGLSKDFLLVRGDGGLPALPLIIDGMSFYPDVEVAAQSDRYLGVEVKFLRTAADATGSLSKALGQAAIYRALGIRSVHVVLLDVRPGVRLDDPSVDGFLAQVRTEDIHVHWYAPASGVLIQRGKRPDEPSRSDSASEASGSLG
jgi:hypothetical protein